MRTSLLALSLVAGSATADMVAFTNANSFGAMLKRGDTILKRQGYSPDTTYCGRGDTCAEACGTGSVECPSTDTSMLYCHDSRDGSKCCPDGSGNSCDAGFYCTSDNVGDTYCCPDGTDTAACAAQYSLSVSLVRQTAVITPSATPLDTTLPVQTPVSTSLLDNASSENSSASRTSARTTAAIPTSRPNTSSTATAATPSQVTGGAGKVMGAGAAIVAGAMGFAGLL